MANSKQWLDTDEVLQSYKQGGYVTCDADVQEVDPRRIIALSRACEEIASDERMEDLRYQVEKNGWLNQHQRSLSLVRLPNGDLVVYGGGNHRAVLSNELEIEKIQAALTVLIPLEKIPTGIRRKVEGIEVKINETRDFEAADHYDSIKNDLLIGVAKSLGYI